MWFWEETAQLPEFEKFLEWGKELQRKILIVQLFRTHMISHGMEPTRAENDEFWDELQLK